MNELEKESFRLTFEFYLKIRENPIRDQAGWDKFAEEVGDLAEQLKCDDNPLGWNLLIAVLETINTLYAGGKIPMPEGYMKQVCPELEAIPGEQKTEPVTASEPDAVQVRMEGL